jgi:tRNA(Ile)-lysidine synthase
VHDESNDDVDIPRNRVRRELLPLLEQRFNPSIVDVLAGEADLARDEWAWIEEAVKRATGGVVRREAGHVWSLDAEALGRMPRALARPVVRQALLDASEGAAVAFSHVEAALRVAEGREGPADGPGVRMERAGGRLVLTSRTAGLERHPVNLFNHPLSIPGEVAGEGGWVVSAETAPSSDTVSAGVSSPGTGVLRLDRCRLPLMVRNRRPGDRFRPLGLGGRKKLQDYFVDKKVPRDRRDQVPLVVDENDRILWVGGYVIDDDFRVTDPAQAVLILRLRQL